MLGWMLRRGEDAPDAAGDADTTQIDQPDTPAPVFAARAFKSALFGTPARSSEMPEPDTRATTDRAIANGEQDSKTPQKPQGILLTPGTGTSRRKRVSFGQDVGKKTSGSLAVAATEPRHRSRLSNALGKFSQDRKKSVVTKIATQQDKDDFSDDEWEEDNDDENCQDVTVDLNEPHSQSGRYWKEEFQKYHEDAKAEMEKLLKYKQLAKSYAKQKDAEATQLAEMLKEEQQKVITMEKQIVEGASKMVSKRDDSSSNEASPELLSTLTKQTALAVQYRTRVLELEEQLEEFLRDRESDSDTKGRRRRLATSPRTQRTLLETQRELRRARSQVKELSELRDQVSTLKSHLRSAERRAAKAESLGTIDGDVPRESSRAQELRSQLRDAKEETRKKDDELRQLKKEFDAYMEETKAREEDTKGVLERAHNKISDLKKEVRTLKASPTEQGTRPKSWHPPVDVDLLAEAGAKMDSKPMTNGVARRSFDLADLDEAPERMAQTRTARKLPEKSHGTNQKVAQPDLGARPTSTALAERPDLGRPRWQPFIPRSPRNRDYLGEEITNAIQNGGATLTAMKPKDIEAPDLPTLAKTIAHSTRHWSTDKIDTRVDLIQDRFAPVGGQDVNTSAFLANNSKSTLPPERRAAAIARIEQRMAEKKRAQRQRGYDKENLRP